MDVWQFILTQLEQNTKVVLLCVLESRGSSPGRKGFVMAVAETGVFKGTIGGGIMEVKLIELAKHQLAVGDHKPIIKEQFHDKSHPRNQSGLICSGSQTVALIPLSEKAMPTITAVAHRKDSLTVTVDSKHGLRILAAQQEEQDKSKAGTEEQFTLVLPHPKTIHIFGAGHVGLALARQMSLLGYRILQYDDRPQIANLLNNQITWPLKIIDYNRIQQEVEAQPSDVVAIVSFSYRSDKVILQQLYQKTFAYIGMMGSDHKIATLKKELAEEGIPEQAIAHVFAPIGLNMYSKTAEEIAISIAGQIILETNKHLPTGRSYEL